MSNIYKVSITTFILVLISIIALILYKAESHKQFFIEQKKQDFYNAQKALIELNGYSSFDVCIKYEYTRYSKECSLYQTIYIDSEKKLQSLMQNNNFYELIFSEWEK